MAIWNAIILTCPNKNSSLAYQKELKLRQEKSQIDKRTHVICIEDPEKSIGSGGATLNALFILVETLSAQKKFKVPQCEVLKDAYVLIMHMGRHYPFDIVGKAFSTLPLQDEENYNILTNFDLLLNAMTCNVAGLNEERPRSDPGIYICSTDMLIQFQSNLTIREKAICVASYLANEKLARENGIYILNKEKNIVEDILYQPSNDILSENASENGLYPLVSGIVYFGYEVACNLYNLSLIDPLDACSFLGIDSGASPLYISLFFDILLASCKRVDLEQYLNGSFKTNYSMAHAERVLTRRARSTLHNCLKAFTISNMTINPDGETSYVYMNSATIDHKRNIFHQQNNKRVSSILNSTAFASNNDCFLVNCLMEKSQTVIGESSAVLNSVFKSSKITIGSNSYITDVKWEDGIIKVPSNMFIQTVHVNLECLQQEIEFNVTFGTRDNLATPFSDKNWTIFNKSWSEFQRNTCVTERDLWDDSVVLSARTLSNAKLFPLINPNLSQEKMANVQQFFWINLLQSLNSNELKNLCASSLIADWKQSFRLSLNDIFKVVNFDRTFQQRRAIFNEINNQMLVKNIVENKCIKFVPLIRNAIHDGFANDILKYLDAAALENASDLILLPRIMAFMSNTLCEMALDYRTLRSGPNLNVRWLDSIDLIESGDITNAILALKKERLNWLERKDLLIRASRHYEGAMLALIRKATSSFYSENSPNKKIILKKIPSTEKKFEWVESNSPARLDLAGAWSDTPPITYECPGGSCVTNVAILINGTKPIGSRGRVLTTTNEACTVRVVMRESASDTSNRVQFELRDLNDFRDYNKPLAVACLVKAVCVFTKLVELNSNEKDLHEQLKEKVNGSVELHTWTGLPQGSGLGTSSILAACVLKVVWSLLGIDVSNETLSYAVLVVEQLMTTNGGWQDQVGGLWGGFKFTRAKNQLPLEIDIRTLNIDGNVLQELNERLVIIYTGVTRLAKDLLLNVLRNWYAISSEIYENVQNLVKNGNKCAKALENGNICEFGECISLHRKQKLIMAPDSEPERIRLLFSKLEPHVHGMAMAGAGGGGFLYAIAKEANAKRQIQQIIETVDVNMKIYDAKIVDVNDGIECNFY